ncbi:MAG: glycosyltransferase, partial [Patescibacteria group bacterium]
MMVSIIIPTKNEIQNLTKTLPQYDAIKGQIPFELIVADGGSEDGTIAFAEKYGAAVVVNRERETIAKGRNRGAQVAQGEVLVFIDAGVRIKDPKVFFETIVKLFNENPHLVAAVPRVDIHPNEATTADTFVHGAVNAIIHFFNAVGLGAGKGETQIIRREAFKKVSGYNERL